MQSPHNSVVALLDISLKKMKNYVHVKTNTHSRFFSHNSQKQKYPNVLWWVNDEQTSTFMSQNTTQWQKGTKNWYKQQLG